NGSAEVGCITVGVNGSVGEENPIAIAVGCADGRGDRCAPWSRCPVIGGVSEGVDVSGGSHEPVAVPAGVGHHRHGCTGTSSDPRTRTLELGVSEGEHSSIGGHHEV